MKKRLFITVFIIAAVLLLPIPEKINKELCGLETVSGEAADISLDICRLKFLVLEDKLKMTITVKTKDEIYTYGKHLNYTGKQLLENGDEIYCFSGWFYNESLYLREYEDGTVSNAQVGFEPLVAYLSSDFGKIVIRHSKDKEIIGQETCRYIGAEDENKLKETEEYFNGF